MGDAEERERRLATELRERGEELDAVRRELQHVVSRLVFATEAERARISTGLHDSTLRGVTAALLASEEALANPSRDQPQLEAALRRIRRHLGDATRELRTLLFDLFPPALPTEGLAAALHELAGTVIARGLEVRLEVDGDDDVLDDRINRLAYRTIHQAVENVLLHAEASSLSINVRIGDTHLAASVSDDGRGFSKHTYDGRLAAGHIGVASMSETIALLQGTFWIGSGESGTTVTFDLPLS